MTAAAARRLVVVRHGETLDNASGVWQGHRDSELSPVGLAQAERAAPALAAYEPQLIVTSDLLRARVTAERIAAVCGLPLGVDARLREVDVGEWQGLRSAEARSRDPELFAALGRGEDVRRGRTGETVAELAKRVREGLDAVLDRLEPGRVGLVVCHGVASRAGIADLVGLEPVAAQQALGGLANCHWAVAAETSLLFGAPAPAPWRIEAWNVGATG